MHDEPSSHPNGPIEKFGYQAGLLARGGRKVQLSNLPIPIPSSNCIGRHNWYILTSDFCIRRLYWSVSTSDFCIGPLYQSISRFDFCSQAIESVRFKVARLLNRPILLVTQLNDRIVIGRSINQTFRPSIKATTTFEKFSEAYISGFRNSRRILEYGPKTPCHELKYIFYTCF